MKIIPLLLILAVLPSCAVFDRLSPRTGPAATPGADDVRPVQRPSETVGSGQTGAIGGLGQSAESLDTTTKEERIAATQTGGAKTALGETVASLGDPTQAGFWLKTPLVSSEGSGSVEAPDGTSVQVTLIPIEGAASAGSRLSLAAMRALGLGLTDLPTVKVFKG